jgi:hypothetical protein
MIMAQSTHQPTDRRNKSRALALYLTGNKQYMRWNMLGSKKSVQVVLLSILLGLTACAQTSQQIGHSVNLCCPGNYGEYKEYRLETQDIPSFLNAYVVSEFDSVFQEKGLMRNDSRNQVRITLSYQHVNLNPEQETIDPFERQLVDDVTLRYIATIVVDIRESSTGEMVWSGQINRIHTVVPGEYMHEDVARPEFAGAFREMLASYPVLTE